MNKFIPHFILVGVMSLVCACSNQPANTLGALQYEPEEESEQEEAIEIKPVTHEDVRAEYQELLYLFEEENLKEQIERRIADVYMMEGVQDQNTAKKAKGYYRDAIKAYRRVLEKYPNSPDNAEVLYQLAKAYDLEAQQEEALQVLTQLTTRYPNYSNIAEAYFRKGDIHFNNQQYQKSQRDYLAVIKFGSEKLKINAHYMLGWSYYKRHRYSKSLQAYTYVFNQLLAKQDNVEALSKTEKPLVDDTIYSMSLTLDKLGGAKVIASVPALAKQDYVWMVYENLGEYYLKKELYEDSANTYRLYVDGYRSAKKAPDLHAKLINAYIEGGFARQSLEEKETYVNYYGLDSNYPGNRKGLDPRVVRPIKTYLDELASHYHSEGQLYEKDVAQLAAAKAKNKRIDEKKYKDLDRLMIASFDRATGFYQQFVNTFPKDERIDEIYFLKAEAHFSARKYPPAIADYERVAYRPLGTSAKEHAANAGYAAIISYENHIASLTPDSEESASWKSQSVTSMLQFAEVFHQDERSPSVLTNAAELLFGLNQYKKAIQVSSKIINNNQALDKNLKKTAYGIVAHSYFKLEDYQNAEDNYFNQRALVAVKSQEYQQISERLAASIYKKSEVLIEAGEEENAVGQLLKMKQLTPESPVRIIAQYDAATLLLGLERWSAAIPELVELRTLYSDHELAVEFPRKLALAYEKNKDWGEAATTYLELSNKDPDPEIRREALFVAANMFERNLNYSTAIQYFKRYAYQYEQPFDTRMEARYHLATNYEKLGEEGKRNYWLRRIIAGDKEAGNQRNERSQWLAAWANMKYGDYYAEQFKRKKLTLPLAKSVSGKNKLLENASSRYQMAAEYGILEFVTMSSYKLGALYSSFAQDLRASPKPRGLSLEDRQIYADILEEQARPLDQLAMELHQANIDRAWDGEFNKWISLSFKAMGKLNPMRFDKVELAVSYGDEIR